MTCQNKKYQSELYGYLCRDHFRVFVILIALFFLSACMSTSRQAPVSSRLPPPSIKSSQHIVAAGETLFSIAWRYDLDYKNLARANGISSAYEIYPGQAIFLNDKISPKSQPNSTISRSKVNPRTASRTLAEAKKAPITQRSANNSGTIASKQEIASARSEKKAKMIKKSPASTKKVGPLSWRWPATGIVTTNFNTQKGLRRGIDIDGKTGDSVHAAASGKVVYAGSGLRGYGKLIIIKHSEIYLSAYAHNNRLNVSEGDIVKVGQRIADIGSTGIGTKATPRLHFQIRRDGKPIDPLPLLPKR
jgi:lipoprotein NlpD